MNRKDSGYSDRPDSYGQIVGPGTVRIERLLPGPIERVWEYLTDSEKRGQWFASGPMELRAGGSIELRFRHADLSAEKETPERFKQYSDGFIQHSQVTRCEPPCLLSFTGWDHSEVTFELSPEGDKVRLVLTHRRLPSRGDIVGTSSGWHAHLGILEDNLNGVEPRPFWTTHARLEADYETRIPANVQPAPKRE